MNAIFDVVTYPWFRELDRLEDASSDNWEFVKVQRRNDDGTLRTWMVPEKDGIAAHLVNLHKIYSLNTRTGELWYGDSVQVIALKCCLLILANPIHTAGAITWNICKIPVDITSFFLLTVYKLFETTQQPENFFQEYYEYLKEAVVDITYSLASDVVGPFRAIWYGLGLEIVAFEGMLSDPRRARVKMGYIERTWNHGISRYYTYVNQDQLLPPANERECADYWHCLNNIKTFYLADCMQKQGDIDDRIGDGSESEESRWRVIDHYATWEAAHPNVKVPDCDVLVDKCCPLTNLCYN